MKKIINRFIVWYILRYYNAVLRYGEKVVRVYSRSFYDDVVLENLITMAKKVQRKARTRNDL